MKKDIILAGVGGHGILSIAAIIGYAALLKNLYLKQSEVHGMSQRGGDVVSNLRISDKPIFSDLIPVGGADVVLATEPMEALRYKHYLHKDGWIITNITPEKNIPNYPDLEEILAEIKKVPNHILIDANKIAKEIKSRRSMNIVLLGAAAPFLGLDYKDLEEGIKAIFARKGEEIVNVNLVALNAGKEAGKAFQDKLKINS